METLMFAVIAVDPETKRDLLLYGGQQVVINVFDTRIEAEAAVLVANGIGFGWEYRVSEFLL